MRQWLLLALVALTIARPAGADPPDATILRVFLKDGTAVASFGEYARIGDRVVFSMLLGGGPPRVQLVNLPASAVDWPKTTRYAEAARYAHYVATRAPADYLALTSEVARALNHIAQAADTATKLDVALRVQRLLAEWPARHSGYRAKDLQEMAALLDEAISELRAASGARQFTLSLVATVEPPATDMLLPAPTAAETIEQGLAVARTSDIAAERVSLLHRVAALVEEAASGLPAAWVTWARESVRQALEIELRIEREYTRLVRRLLGLADTRAAHADVRGVESIVRAAHRADRRLGGKRPGQMAALMQELEQRLEDARRLRLARDRWALNVEQYRVYRRDALPLFGAVERSRSDLEQIRALAGPEVTNLQTLLQRLQSGLTTASAMRAPAGLEMLHATLVSSLQLGIHAARMRQAAAASANLSQAWDASSAAAGALMLAERARSDLDRAMRPPQVP